MKRLNLLRPLVFFRLCLLIGLTVMVQGSNLWAQEEEQTEPEKKNARLSLMFLNVNNEESQLIATVKTRVERSYENVAGVPVDFYLNDPDGKLGTATTNKKGEAILDLPASLMEAQDTLNSFIFLAAIGENEEYEEDEDDIEIWRSHVALELEVEDSVKWVRFLVSEPDSLGEWVGVEDVEATIFVERLFGLLPVSEAFETTGEEGYLEVEFPDDIPGDAAGQLTILARVDDHDRFGSLKISKSIAWGVPKKHDPERLSRELWSSRSNAPVYLIVLVNLTILGIWGFIAYIISQIFKIKRLGNET